MGYVLSYSRVISSDTDIQGGVDLFGEDELDLGALGLADVDLALLQRLGPLHDVRHVLAQLRRLVLASDLGHSHSHLLALSVVNRFMDGCHSGVEER